MGFLMESTAVSFHWKTSLNVGALVTLVAAVHYFYMREYWVQLGSSPIVYRYIDWTITVPLQMVEFYLILAAVQPTINAGIFWRLLLGTVAMGVAGYCGEAGFVNPWAGFLVGMAGWAFILFEVFSGEAGKLAEDDKIGEREDLLPDHAHHRLCRLVHLPSGLLLRLLARQREGRPAQLDLQRCGCHQQDCFLPCHLALRQEGHHGEG